MKYGEIHCCCAVFELWLPLLSVGPPPLRQMLWFLQRGLELGSCWGGGHLGGIMTEACVYHIQNQQAAQRQLF